MGVSPQELLRQYAASRRAGLNEEALEILDRLLKDHPGNARLAYLKARTLDCMGRHAEAVPWFEQGLAHHLGPERKPALSGKRSYCLIGLPRSASSSLSDTVASTTGSTVMQIGFGELVPAIDVRVHPAYLAVFNSGGYVSHTHLSPISENLAALCAGGINRLFIQLRNPRDSFVSFVWYAERSTEIISRLNYIRPGYSRLSIEQKARFLLAAYYPSLLRWIAGWRAIAEQPPPGLSVMIGTLEDLIDDQPQYIERLSRFLDIPADRIRQVKDDPNRRQRKSSEDLYRFVDDLEGQFISLENG